MCYLCFCPKGNATLHLYPHFKPLQEFKGMNIPHLASRSLLACFLVLESLPLSHFVSSVNFQEFQSTWARRSAHQGRRGSAWWPLWIRQGWWTAIWSTPLMWMRLSCGSVSSPPPDIFCSRCPIKRQRTSPFARNCNLDSETDPVALQSFINPCGAELAALVSFAHSRRRSLVSSGDLCDLILVFFDPMGQALCKRTLNIVESLNETHGDRLRFYLSKADEAGGESDRQVLRCPSTAPPKRFHV